MVINNFFIPDILFDRFIIAAILNMNMLSIFTTAVQSSGGKGSVESSGHMVALRRVVFAVVWILEQNI